ncbi:hypothetical protein BD560DRAFT_436637 [Blakeslea trispora]|nr:hypothetical protein BD560DRAFT_436637 [Blakeslea trispora]
MSRLFQDYRFGSEIDSSDNRSNTSLIAPNSDRPSIEDNAYYPPLTKSALDYQDRLDLHVTKKATSLLNSTRMSYGSIYNESIESTIEEEEEQPSTSTSIPLPIHTNKSWLNSLVLLIAERVIDSRVSEPREIRISVDVASDAISFQSLFGFSSHADPLLDKSTVQPKLVQLEGWSLFLYYPQVQSESDYGNGLAQGMRMRD